jgi:hypothetical protein
MFNAVSKTALVISALIFSTVIGNAQSVPAGAGPSAGGAPTSTTGAPPPAMNSDASKPPATDKSANAPTTSQSNTGTHGSPTQTTASPSSPNSGSTASPSSPASASAAVNVTPEQKTVIRQTIINNNNAPRVSSLNFSIGVGVAVPTSITFAPLPPTILSLYPSWQAYHYFVYQEELVIVDPVTRQIIAVIRV